VSQRLRQSIFLGWITLFLGIMATRLPIQPAVAAPLQAALPPAPGRIQVSAWMPTSWDGASAWASFRAHAAQLDAVSPFWYEAGADGALLPLKGARDETLLQEARFAGARVIPTISNHYDGNRIHTILTDETLAEAHRQAIINEVTLFDYDGIDLDYEGLLADDRDLFSAWVHTLADELHRNNKALTITVQPKTFDADGWNGPGAQDYRALASAADELRIMTYGWCWQTGCVDSAPPGPIAPIHWMRRVIDYAKTQASPQKLVLGVHLYGYDWWEENKRLFLPLELADMTGQALVWEQAEALHQEYDAELRWWESDDWGPVREPWFTYDEGAHVVVFANADSVAARAQLAAEEGLRGIILWRLGGEDPMLWRRLPTRSYRNFLPIMRPTD